jgi:hypothetical protein
MKMNKLNRNTISKQERLPNMKKLVLVVLALSVCALAAESSLEERVDVLQAQIDRAMSKAGIHFGGEFRSQFLNSKVSDDAVADVGKNTESVEYTSVDFNIVARPNAALSARAMFRLHQDWRNFFSDVQNPITTRWLSIDGSVAHGILKYNLGDYKKKMTPLTLWSPDIELLYEPEIFAQGRELAMSEVFLGGNNRVLQGANLELRGELGTEFSTILEELDVDVFGARLATRGTGESGVISPGIATEPDGKYWDNDYDKYLVGLNLAAHIIYGTEIGVSNLTVFDNIPSYKGDSTDAKLNSNSNNVFAARLGLDSRIFMPEDFIKFGLGAEVAFSGDKSYHKVIDKVEDGDTTFKRDGNGMLVLEDTTVSGMALNARLFFNLNLNDDNSIKLSANYIQNDREFRNDVAQSPTFIQRNIMNNENGMSGLGLMNPFDAMYRSVFKYAPSQYFGGPKPYTKNAYINSILTKDKNDEISDGEGFVYPNVFQTAMPGGFASADRGGPVIDLDGSFLDEALTLGVRVAMLKEVKEDMLEYKYPINNSDGTFSGNSGDGKRTISPSEYMNAGGGASIDIAKFLPALGPSLKIGGSFMMYNAEQSAIVEEAAKMEYNQKTESQLISAEIVYNFVPRFSFLFGYQSLSATFKSETKIDGASEQAPDREYNFSNLGVGFGYKVADGGALTVKLTMLSGEGPAGADDKTLKYTAMQPEVYLTVKF